MNNIEPLSIIRARDNDRRSEVVNEYMMKGIDINDIFIKVIEKIISLNSSMTNVRPGADVVDSVFGVFGKINDLLGTNWDTRVLGSRMDILIKGNNDTLDFFMKNYTINFNYVYNNVNDKAIDGLGRLILGQV